MKINYNIVFSKAKNIGAEYNRRMKEVGDNDWVCFIDGDACFTTPNFGTQLEAVIKNNPDIHLFTAMTNRVGRPEQCVPEQWENNDYNSHFNIGRLLQEKHWDKVKELDKPLSGMLMLIKKSMWKEVGGFKSKGMLGVDNDFCIKVQEEGYKVGIMQGVYVLHYYRGGEQHKMEHLSSEPEPERETMVVKPKEIKAPVLDTGNKIAMYTAIIGNYDQLIEPEFADVDIDYFLFTTQDFESDVFNIIRIEDNFDTEHEKIKLARNLKINPHLFLPAHYERTIWTDGNFSQKQSLYKPLSQHKRFITVMKHPQRGCLYEEALICGSMNKDNPITIAKQIERYKNEYYPEKNGLIASGFIIRDNIPAVHKLCDLWWNEVRNGSIRDQLSFNYAAWKTGTKYTALDFNYIWSEIFTHTFHRQRKTSKLADFRHGANQQLAQREIVEPIKHPEFKDVRIEQEEYQRELNDNGVTGTFTPQSEYEKSMPANQMPDLPIDQFQTHTDIINYFAAQIKAVNYLEIGVSTAVNINKINIPNKTGVDPDPACANNYPDVLQMTSDNFFEVNGVKYDIIFIDGLHHAEQVYKDIKNAVKTLTDNGIIVCHDMIPPDEAHQIIPRIQKQWTGDCWKAWVRTRMERDDLQMFVINRDYGCGVIRKGSQELLKYDKELTWANYVQDKQLLMNIVG